MAVRATYKWHIASAIMLLSRVVSGDVQTVQVIQMHFLRLFLTAWLALGIATVFLLFWLCKRTARRNNMLDGPVPDQNMFQRHLGAAHTESVPRQSDVEPLARSNPSTVLGLHGRMVRRPTPPSDELFWRAATGLAMAAVSALLLVASSDRLSPVPSQLVLPSDVVQQQVPFRRAPHIVTVPTQGGGVGIKTVVMERQATKTGPIGIERSVVADRPVARSASTRKIVSSKRHSIYEGEGDMVAQDIVVRYERHTALQ